MSMEPTNRAEIYADFPLSGWYRMRRYRNGPWLPVCIWEQDGKLVARVADKMEDPAEIWTFVADKRVSPEDARFAFAHGRWPSQPEPIPALSNLPADPYEALLLEVEEHIGRATGWINQHRLLQNQEEADFARHLQVEIQNLKKRADALHAGEKRPVLDAGKKVDERYRFRDGLDAGNRMLRDLVTDFLKRLAAEQAKMAEAKRRIDAESAAVVEFDKPRAGGMVGKRVGLATTWRAEVMDYQAAAAYFIGHPDLKGVIQKLANHAVRDAKGSIAIPGVKNLEDQVAR